MVGKLPLKRNYRKSASIHRKQANQQLKRIKADITGHIVKRRHTNISANYKYLVLIAKEDGCFKIADFANKTAYLEGQSTISIMRAYKYRTSKQRINAMNKIEKYRKVLADKR